MNVFQERILEHVAALADEHRCIKAIYIFGSVARSETANCNDVDLSVDYFDIAEMARDYRKGATYAKFQATFEDWATSRASHSHGRFAGRTSTSTTLRTMPGRQHARRLSPP